MSCRVVVTVNRKSANGETAVHFLFIILSGHHISSIQDQSGFDVHGILGRRLRTRVEETGHHDLIVLHYLNHCGRVKVRSGGRVGEEVDAPVLSGENSKFLILRCRGQPSRYASRIFANVIPINIYRTRGTCIRTPNQSCVLEVMENLVV